MIVLITGPVRSGKSTRAAGIARGLGRDVVHVVTARLDPADREMAQRVERHRAERGGERTIELWQPDSPDLARLVATTDAARTLVIDSLGTWLAGHLLDLQALVEADPLAAQERLEACVEPFVAALPAARGNVVIVAEETGWGIVPVSAQGRLFRDVLGRLTQRIGRIAARTELVVAGYAIDLGAVGVPVDERAVPVSGR